MRFLKTWDSRKPHIQEGILRMMRDEIRTRVREISEKRMGFRGKLTAEYLMKPGECVVDVENLEVPAEDSAALERALKAYREFKSIRRRKPARVPSSVRESS